MKKQYVMLLAVGIMNGLYAQQAPQTASWWFWGGRQTTQPAQRQLSQIPLSMELYIRNYGQATDGQKDAFINNATQQQIAVLNKLDDAMRARQDIRLSPQESRIFFTMPSFVQRLFHGGKGKGEGS